MSPSNCNNIGQSLILEIPAFKEVVYRFMLQIEKTIGEEYVPLTTQTAGVPLYIFSKNIYLTF